eukprot:6809415-Lingulodinium_polyedra.AAC.1
MRSRVPHCTQSCKGREARSTTILNLARGPMRPSPPERSASPTARASNAGSRWSPGMQIRCRRGPCKSRWTRAPSPLSMAKMRAA